MNPALALLAVIVLMAALFIAVVFVWRVRSDDYEARHRQDGQVRLPRQLTERTLDFDDWGRPW